MNTKLFTGLALAAVLLIGGPAFGRDDRAASRGAPRGRAVAVVHRVARSHAVVAYRGRGAGRTSPMMASRTYRGSRSTTFASRGTFNVRANRSYTSRSPSVAFAGSTHQFANNARGQYAFASHAGWSHNQQYNWNGRNYRWYNNGWFIIGPYPYYYGNYGPGYYNGGSLSAEVQSALEQQGYYQGPIDGVVGPGTQAAIANYQQNNGLRVTGTITAGLLRDLGVS